MKGDYGTRITVWLSAPIHDRIVEASKKVGLSQSGFLKYAALKELERLESKEGVGR